MSEATIQTAVLSFGSNVIDSLAGLPASTGTTAVLNQFKEDDTITPTTPVPATKIHSQELTIGGGGTTDLDFTSLVGSQDNFDASTPGLKLQFIYVKNKGSNPVSLDPAQANGYDDFNNGLLLEIQAGSKYCQSFNDKLIDVSATKKILRFTGTIAEKHDVTLIFG